MSDELPNPLNAFDFDSVSDRDVILSIVNERFFADYGIVQAITSTTVDVEHAMLSVTREGIVAPSRVLPAVVTKEIEILWPSMSGLSIKGTIKKGDLVLLIGLRNLLPSTVGVTEAKTPPEFWHYSQQTLKAIPVSGVVDTAVQFGENGGKAYLRNQAASLFTILSNLIQGIQGATANGYSIVDVTGKIAEAQTQNGQLLEE